MLNEISGRSAFKILAVQPAATPDQVQKLNDYFGQCPPEYVDLIYKATEIEMQHSEGQYVRIWGPLGCIEMDKGYGIRQYMPSAFPIGDDGGGHIIFFAEGKHGYGLYYVGYGDLDLDDAIWIAPDLRTFLVNAEGIDTF
ncbi:1,3-beta-glucan synthase regulator [Blastopirellula marina]|uniref:1,3-beta-glucan synthase regulator n=1 Tax=Blastopirellula marina TaxID=124 RepID=A0A2S8GQE6_9BACT|nr:1,3-beta-glucan synthase regulator [Blastopirellula marina]PQO46658.1 1,3-beta-glucan synthase regulator [Blastopirellula marina]